MKFKSLLIAILLFIGCGYGMNTYTDNVSPDHNIWIIGDSAICTDIIVFDLQARAICEGYGQEPTNYNYVTSCLKWYWGIFGPYAAPGSYYLEFQCE